MGEAGVNHPDRWRERLLEVLVEDRAGGDEGAWQRESDDGRTEVLSFRLGADTYGVLIGDVAEILLPRPVTALPRSPAFVLGIASVRGTVLPVVDLALRLGVPGGDRCRANRIVVIRDGEERLGFWVDRVCGVVRFQPGEMEAGEYASAVDPRFLDGLGYLPEGTLVGVLSAGALCDFGREAP